MTPANTVVDTWTVDKKVASPTAVHIAPQAYLVSDTDGVACSAAALPNKPSHASTMTTPAGTPAAVTGVHLLVGGCSAAVLPK